MPADIQAILHAIFTPEQLAEADTFWGRCEPGHKFGPFRNTAAVWRADDTCDYCGGKRPSILLQLLREGQTTVSPTDKNYKVYFTLKNEHPDEMRVISVINHDPGGDTRYVPADPALLKRDGWGEGGKWMQLAPRGPTQTKKCYLNHFSAAQAVEFVLLKETGQLPLDYPGFFYSGLCFGVYKDEINKALALLREQVGVPTATPATQNGTNHG